MTTSLEVRKRIASLFFLFLIAITLLAGRFFWVQVVRGSQLAEKALENRMRDRTVKAKRGILYDRNGRELAISISTDSVYAVPAEISKKEAKETARKLASVLPGTKEEDIYKKLTKESDFVWIKRGVDAEISNQIKKMKLKGIDFVEESRRFYPKGKLAAHILGISSIDNVGLEGIDYYYNDVVGGKDGRILVEYDAVGREIPEATHRYIAPQQGSSLVLTIDETIQYIVERELDKVMETRNPKGACAIVMDPKTGEILALASRPTFDPNKYSEYPAANRRNMVVNNAYEPGSTMKIITAAAAMEEGVVHPGDSFYCPGYIKVGKETIRCANGVRHGAQSFNEVVAHSCNVGFVTVGLRLGKDLFYRYLNAFKLGDKTGVDLPGEARGIIVSQSKCTQLDLATMSFGQTNAITPLQNITAACAVANGGILMKPHLVKKIINTQGEVEKEIQPTQVRQVVSKQTAQELCLMLEEVVKTGSGHNAYIEGYRVAGKTGTAQKPAPGGGYMTNEYLASFLGFAPANDPRLVCLVIVDAPQGYPYFGGWVAAPVFKNIISDSLRYLEVPMDSIPAAESEGKAKAEKVTVPDVVNMKLEEGLAALKKAGLKPKVEGEGSIVWGQIPKAYTEVAPGSQVVVSLTPVPTSHSSGQVTVPDLIGKSMKESAQILSRLNLHMTPLGSGLAYKQEPEAGTKVPVGTQVKVEFKPVE